MIFSFNLYDEEGWEDAKGYQEGTKRKVLRDENCCKTILLKLPQHFHMEAHSHVNAEQHFVIEGSYAINNIPFAKGSYQRIPPNEEHGTFTSEDGALLLVMWDPAKKQ
ncbi:MAG: cupin domain-containing protein [Bacteroidota bacterium]